MKLVVGLGNPGPEYDATRHNVGWWLAERLVADWGFGGWQRRDDVMVAGGRRGDEDVWVVRPVAWMNRSGPALVPLLAEMDGFEPARDLLVLVDDVALEVGRVRFRRAGSAGGHNGLRSIEAVLGGGDWARLRIGVGSCPDDTDLVDWVLSAMPAGDEDEILSLLPSLVEGVGVWIDEGIEAAMNRFNR